MKTIKISSLEGAELSPYLTLRRPADHLEQGIFVAEGEKVVRRLLSSGLEIVSMLLTPEWHERLFSAGMPDTRSAQKGTIFVAGKELLESIVGFNLHQGIMAVGRTPREKPLEELIGSVTPPFFLVALDGLVNAENIGVIVRNCAGFGADAIIVGENSSSPYLRRAVRNSMGTVFSVPIFHALSLKESLLTLREKYSARIVAAHLDESHDIYGADFSGNFCMVFGNEGSGLSADIAGVCDDRVVIPMMRGTDSLNVASASAVFLYEARKQRMEHATRIRERAKKDNNR